MSPKFAVKETAEALRRHVCEGSDAEREALELVSFVTGLGRADLIFADAIELTESQESKLRELTKRRLKHEPLPYLLVSAFFLGREFTVTRDTLIPRPATEIIVSRLIDDWRGKGVSIVDVGTGSGCAAISFALELPQATVIATDISEAALAVAHRNAERHKMTDRIAFLRGDLLASAPSVPCVPLAKTDRRFPAENCLTVFANLPYIPTADIASLAPDVRDFEPHSALDGGMDGLDVFRRLFRKLAENPMPNRTHIYLEALPKQLDVLALLITEHWPNARTEKIFADSVRNFPIGLKAGPLAESAT